MIESIPRDGDAENMIFKVFKIDHQIKWDFLKAPLFITVIRNPFLVELKCIAGWTSRQSRMFGI